MRIKLTGAELLIGIMAGARRLLDSASKDHENVADCERNWATDIEVALAEFAVAKASGRFFDPNIGRFKAKDVGNYHVRHTTIPSGCLIIRPDDPDGIYVLVTGKFGVYEVRGFIAAEYARTLTQYTREENGRAAALFIPQDRLDRMDVE